MLWNIIQKIIATIYRTDCSKLILLHSLNHVFLLEIRVFVKIYRKGLKCKTDRIYSMIKKYKRHCVIPNNIQDI
jgi:hypothetical protein